MAAVWGQSLDEPLLGPPRAEAQPDTTARQVAPVLRQRQFRFEDLAGRPSETLRGVEGIHSWPFGIRLDQTVVEARLDLRLIASPALISTLSHLRVALNGEVFHVIRLDPEELGQPIERSLRIDPGYFSDFNELTIRLIGHYTEGCEDPNHSSLWATISGDSTLHVTTRPLGLSPDLALLPVPFFDPRDGDRVELPVVFAQAPDAHALRAAGIVASHFGALADYRSARFPVRISRLPTDSHAVVLSHGDPRPAGLALVDASEPSLSVMANPVAPDKRLLVLHAPSAERLPQVAAGLVLAAGGLTGSRARVTQVEVPESAQLFDGPRWAPTDRPVTLADLVEDVQDLEVAGHAPVPIVVNLRVPPDLFLRQSGRIPMRLGYRYTPPLETDNSMLTVSINDQLVRSMALEPVDPATGLIPGASAAEPFSVAKLPVPHYMVGADNQLSFQFGIDHHKPGPCRDSGADLVRSGLNPDSTIDLTGIPHYAPMPNLELFANAGYPFTRYADLHETAVVMPEQPQTSDIELMLFLMGRLGRLNGVGGHGFALVPASGLGSVEDRDLLVLAPGQLDQWGKRLAASIQASQRSITLGQRLRAAAQRLWMGDEAPTPAWQVSLDAEGSLAALMGFESPETSGRSVVAVAASDPDAQELLISGLERPDRVNRIRGDTVFLRASNIDAYRTQAPYFVGRLPWTQWLRYHLSRHPGWTIAVAVLAALLIGLCLYGFYRRAAERRQAGH